MNYIQQQLVRQMKSFLAFKKEHETEIAENPLLVNMVTDIENIDIDVTALMAQQDRNSKALTHEKSSKSEVLVDKVVNTCDLLNSYGNYVNFAVFTNIEGCSRTELSRCRDEELLIRAGKVKDILSDNPTEASEATVTAEDITALETAIADVQAVIDIPQEFRRIQHEITLKLETDLNNYKGIMNNSLKDYMHSKYKVAKPEFYAAFALSVEIDALPQRKRALIGTITDDNGEPIRNVRVSVDGAKPIIKGGQKGGYFFQNLTAGQHQLTFSRKSYQSVTVNILIVPDHTATLDVVLKYIEVEEAVAAE